MPIKAIACDLDNTLVDFMGFKRKATMAAAKAMVAAGLKANPEEVYKRLFEIYDQYGIEHKKAISKMLWEKYHVRDFNFFEKVQQAGLIAYLKKEFTSMRLYPGVNATLGKLRKKGLKLYIVSDAPRNMAWWRLNQVGLASTFDTVVTFDDSLEAKPSKLPFKALLRRTGLKPKEILFVGDDPEKDIKGAKKFGMLTALALYGWTSNRDSKEKADYKLRRFGEVLKIVKENR